MNVIFPLAVLSEDFLFLFYMLSRVFGLFFISPLLANKGITLTVRVCLSVFTGLLFAIVLYPEYHGEAALFKLGDHHSLQYNQELLLVLLITFKEMAIGYLIGFCFSIIFEGILVAGELIDTMIGFSAMQFYDPFSQTFQSLLTQLLTFTAMLLVLVMDLHHYFFRLLADSFSLIPLGNYHYSQAFGLNLVQTCSMIFIYGLKLAAIPLVILTLTTVGVGFVVRTLPEFSPFAIGFPIRIFVGLFSVIAMLNFFPSFIQEAFFRLSELAKFVLQNLVRD